MARRPFRDALNDPGIQTWSRILNLAFGKTLLHKSGESKANDFRATCGMHFYDGASRCTRYLKQLLPGFRGSGVSNQFRAVLGGVELQASGKVFRVGFAPIKKSGHRHAQ